MKRAICVLLASCTLVAVADEAQQPVSPAPADGIDWLQFKTPHGLAFGPNFALPAFQQRPQSTCYFIRTLKPVLPDSDAQRSGFIKLQSRVTGVESGPVCTTKWPLIRAERKLATAPLVDQPGSEASR